MQHLKPNTTLQGEDTGETGTGGLMAGQVFHNIVEWMAVHDFIKSIKPGGRRS